MDHTVPEPEQLDSPSFDPCSAEAFEARYAADPDPWHFASSSYELERYDALLEIMERDHYRSGYEPGCSVGVLTRKLARRCDSLLAVDVSATAVDAARTRCQDLPQVDVKVAEVGDVGVAEFDLVVMSEIGYYFEVPQLDELLTKLASALVPNGELVACHWTGRSVDHVLTGEVVHRQIAANHDLLLGRSQIHDGFLLETWYRR